MRLLGYVRGREGLTGYLDRPGREEKERTHAMTLIPGCHRSLSATPSPSSKISPLISSPNTVGYLIYSSAVHVWWGGGGGRGSWGGGVEGWTDNGYVLQPKNILPLHNPINRIDRLNAPNIPSISICNCLRHRCSGMEERQPECHLRTLGIEHTTSITLITTQSRGGGVYGALPTTTGRCFALSAQAATLCGDLLWTAWARGRSIWRLSPLFEVSIACFPRCGKWKKDENNNDIV